MALWTNLINALFLPGRPILGSTGIALRDNIQAVAEGAPDAPRLRPKALADNTLIFGPVSSAIALAATDLGGIKRIHFRADKPNTNVGFLQVSFSADNGSTWGGWQQASASSSAVALGWIDLQLRTSSVFSSTTSAPFVPSSPAIPVGANAIRFRESAFSELNTLVHAYVLEGRSDV